ncbi:MAG: hypothetical protein HQK55_09500 [Deltaproteobacteria bacterium]|nr:hypothetical protein [Deltaproteobacteria bacterium]
MQETEATEWVAQAIFETIDRILDEARFQGDTTVLSRLAPVLLSTGALILVDGIGVEKAAEAIKDLAVRVERGDFSRSDLVTTQ